MPPAGRTPRRSSRRGATRASTPTRSTSARAKFRPRGRSWGTKAWRLPTIVELQTILLDPYPCGTSPCIDPVFGPTVANRYWSATTFATSPTDAWYVYFNDGFVAKNNKFGGYDVRAVRAGL